MKKNLKELIAKEGPLVGGILLLAAIIIFVLIVTDIVEVGEGTSQKIVTSLVFLALLAYPIFLLIRLIIRAIRISKEP
ncbi:MAG: hypothetical protein WBC74_00610 [Candidatus Omnitrophota bacterium]